MKQLTIQYENIEKELTYIFQKRNVKRLFIVGTKSMFQLPFFHMLECILEKLEIKRNCFMGFSPNPKYEEVVESVNAFRQSRSQFLMAIGGGSAIDVAKCVKLFAELNTDQNLLEQVIIPNNIPLMAVPTTAGTGSEATQFAVIYKDGEKKSINYKDGLPQYVVLDPYNLLSLPLYQKKATLCDALSHAIESFWSVHSTPESRLLSKEAITLVLSNMNGYLDNDFNACENMLRAANIAGHAINIAFTTAAHAMSYIITSIYGIAHGHAVILCLPEVWEYMWNHVEKCTDKRGSQYVQFMMVEIAKCMSQDTSEEAIRYLKCLRRKLKFPQLADVSEGQFKKMIQSVNRERLSNSPIYWDLDSIAHVYKNVLREAGYGNTEIYGSIEC